MFNKKIVISFWGILFSIGAATTGTFAWFSTNGVVTATGMSVAVANPDINELLDFSLYKFVYPEIKINQNETYVDYLSPANGDVFKYDYNEDENAFGLYEDESFTSYDVNMNIYDPLETLINHTELISMNTNIIYEAKLQFVNKENIILKIDSILEEVVVNKKQIKASECVEFDVFLEGDLSSPNLFDGDTKLYYPSYISQDTVLSHEEEIYYKFSYLSSLSEHKNFFDLEEGNQITLYNSTCPLDSESCANVYINVNYSEEKLASYINDVRLNNLEVVKDYNFRFGFGA